ncbi:MAG: hypothetical protein MIO92_05310 [Methanosarcinaceae archaeon]|nr:hypothetical protein [Methanosarcinaceae archaeon]
MEMGISIGDAIIAGSALFATMGIIIKLLSIRESTIRADIYNSEHTAHPVTTGGSHITRKDLDLIFTERNAKFLNLVTDPVCLARHTSLERHVTDIFTGLAKQIEDVKGSQGKIFDKLDEVRKFQVQTFNKGAI